MPRSMFRLLGLCLLLSMPADSGEPVSYAEFNKLRTKLQRARDYRKLHDLCHEVLKRLEEQGPAGSGTDDAEKTMLWASYAAVEASVMLDDDAETARDGASFLKDHPRHANVPAVRGHYAAAMRRLERLAKEAKAASPDYPAAVCGIKLNTVSRISGMPGDVLELGGVWGDSRGERTPALKAAGPRGGSWPLEVLSWKPDRVRCRIPGRSAADLPPGDYEVGVYCRDPKRSKDRTSTGFSSFRIEGIVTDRSPTFPPCGISLAGLSSGSGEPGTVVELKGTWGPEQGEMLPVLGTDGAYVLEVVSWRDDLVRVRVPGTGKGMRSEIGVFCNAPTLGGGSFSTRWLPFRVLLPSAR